MGNEDSILGLVVGVVAGAGLSAVFSSVVGLWRTLRPAPKAADGVQITVGGSHRRAIRSVTLTFQPPGAAERFDDQ